MITSSQPASTSSPVFISFIVIQQCILNYNELLIIIRKCTGGRRLNGVESTSCLSCSYHLYYVHLDTYMPTHDVLSNSKPGTHPVHFLFSIYYQQSHCIEYAYDRNTNVTKNRCPHIGESQCTEYQHQDFYYQCECYILGGYAHCLFGNTYC